MVPDTAVAAPGFHFRVMQLTVRWVGLDSLYFKRLLHTA